MVNGILGGLKMKSKPKVRDKISRFFFRLKRSLSGRNSAGNPNSVLVPLKKSHLQSFKDYMMGPGNLHIIIYRRGQELSILRPTPYKQSAEILGVISKGSSKRQSKPRSEKDRQKRRTLRKTTL